MRRTFTRREALAIGDAMGVNWRRVSVAQFHRGINVELEHGRRSPCTDVTRDDAIKTAKIALAHLAESRTYYSQLGKMERSMRGLPRPAAGLFRDGACGRRATRSNPSREKVWGPARAYPPGYVRGTGPWQIVVWDGSKWYTSRPYTDMRRAYDRARRIARSLRDVPGARVSFRSYGASTGPKFHVRPNPSECAVARGEFDLYGSPYVADLREDCSVIVRAPVDGRFAPVGMGRWGTDLRVANFRVSDTFQELGGRVDVDTVERSATEALRRVLPSAEARQAATSDPDLVLEHTVEHGTTISGDTRKYAPAIKELRGGFKWWPAGGVWYRQQSRGRATPTVPLETWANRLRAAGATVVVRQQEPVSTEEELRVRRAVLEEKAERAHARAGRAAAESSAQYQKFRGIADRIPMGQPILVGHHSERRHRKDLGRMDSAMHGAIEAQKASERLEARAARLEREAARLEAPVVAQVIDDNAWNERLAKDLAHRWKRNGYTLVRQTAKGKKNGVDWRMFFMRHPDERRSLMLRLSGQTLTVMRVDMTRQVKVPMPRDERTTLEESHLRIADAIRMYLDGTGKR